MLAKRIIPCLDVDRGRVVKGIRFISLVDAGDPLEMIAEGYKLSLADLIAALDFEQTGSRWKLAAAHSDVFTYAPPTAARRSAAPR